MKVDPKITPPPINPTVYATAIELTSAQPGPF